MITLFKNYSFLMDEVDPENNEGCCVCPTQEELKKAVEEALAEAEQKKQDAEKAKAAAKKAKNNASEKKAAAEKAKAEANGETNKTAKSEKTAEADKAQEEADKAQKEAEELDAKAKDAENKATEAQKDYENKNADFMAKAMTIVGDSMSTIKDLASMVDFKTTLPEVSASVTEAKNAIGMLENISFSKVIGEPLKAAINAQSEAAKATLAYINEVGIKNGAVATVSFTFYKGGKMGKVNMPLLTLVPIPTLRIEKMSYAFKVDIDTSSSVNLTTSQENSFKIEANQGGESSSTQPGAQKPTQAQSGAQKPEGTQPGAQKPEGTQPEVQKPEGTQPGEKKSANTANSTNAEAAAAANIKKSVIAQPTFGVSFSTKKDSKATQESKYSVKSTMDITIDVGPDDLPGGVSKLLSILDGATDVYDPNGELTVSATQVNMFQGSAMITATYRDCNGVHNPSAIVCEYQGVASESTRPIFAVSGDVKQIVFRTDGWYTVKAGTQQQIIQVFKEATSAKTTTEE